MSNEEPEPLSDEERRAYRAVAACPPAPAGLEGRIVRTLRRERLLTRPLWQRAAPWALAALAGGGLFLAGRLSSPPASPSPPMTGAPRFVLFLQEPVSASPSPEEEAARVQEYSRWARAQAARGSLLEGEKLKDESAILPALSAGPSRTTGYFVVTAADLDGALALARTCPHLRHGGGIVVRPIDSRR